MTAFEKALNQPEQNNTGIIYNDDKAKSEVLANAVNVLCEALQEGKDSNGSYFHTWQSNIAMAFLDAVDKYCSEHALPNTERDKIIVTSIANNAAINFLNTLCGK